MNALSFFCIALYIILSIFNWTPIEEDAYIYFRFAENIAEGWGYVFNPFDEKVEACSSVIWLSLLVFLKLFGCNVILSAKILGIAIGCLSLCIINKISGCFLNSRYLASLPPFLTALNVPFIMRNQMGLETPISTLIYLCIILILLKNKYSFLLFFLFLCAFALSRPEAIFIAFFVIFFLYWYTNEKKFKIVTLLLCFLIFIAFCTYLRLIYFHDLLPNSFYHKVFPKKYYYGLQYTINFFKDYYAYIFFIPVLLSFFFIKRVWDKKTFFLFILIFINISWIILEGACYFPFYRHFVPVVPLFYILTLSISIKALPQPHSIMAIRSIVAAFIIYAIFILLFPPANWSVWKKDENYVSLNVKAFFKNPFSYISMLEKKIRDPRYEYKNVLDFQTLAGLFIKDNYLPGTTFVYDQMGRLPYNAGNSYFFIDSNGLTEKVIGRTIFCVQNKSSKIFNTYRKIAQTIIQYFYPSEYFYCNGQDAATWIVNREPDVILLCTLMKGIVIDELSKNFYIKQMYLPTYYLPGILFLEKKGLAKKPFKNQYNIPIVMGEKIEEVLKGNEWFKNFSKS
ncbi:MAG: hypothetical protein NC935_03725 [Candidatus Omnitrophica bacterium]|nr:hypothetical protein [Candidatus Omnitrophota bacterium]